MSVLYFFFYTTASDPTNVIYTVGIKIAPLLIL